jgi:hypothetical protein
MALASAFCSAKNTTIDNVKSRGELEQMSIHVIIGLSMVVVGLTLAVYVVALILRERGRDRNIID